MTKQIPPGNVNIEFPEVEQWTSSGVDNEKKNEIKSSLHQPQTQAEAVKGKEMISKKKKLGDAERRREQKNRD